jgi:hypothetical protein
VENPRHSRAVATRNIRNQTRLFIQLATPYAAEIVGPARRQVKEGGPPLTSCLMKRALTASAADLTGWVTHPMICSGR